MKRLSLAARFKKHLRTQELSVGFYASAVNRPTRLSLVRAN